MELPIEISPIGHLQIAYEKMQQLLANSQLKSKNYTP